MTVKHMISAALALLAAHTSRGLVQERTGDVDNARESFNAALAAPAEKFRNSGDAQAIARERLRALAPS